MAEIHNYNANFPEDNKTRVLLINSDGSINVAASSQSTKDGSRDAFGRLRVAQVSTQIDLKQIHDDLPLFFDREEIGTGSSTHVPATSSSNLTTAADGDAVIAQTFQRANYQSGKGQQILLTFSNFEAQTNVQKRVGYFSSNTTTPFNSDLDGIWLEQGTDGVVYFKTSRNGTETNSVAQSEWDDPFDGTGSSGITIDWSKTIIAEIAFEWLGVGSVTLRFVIDGIYYQAHIFKNAQNSTNVYMQSPNQPIRYEIRQSGEGAGQFSQICSTVGSEGAVNEIGKIISDNLGASFVNANTLGTTYALIGLGLQASKADTEIDIVDFNILVGTSTDVLWKVILNPSVAGTFNYSAITNSSIATAKGDTSGDPSTNTVTGGTLLASGYVKSGSGAFSGGAGEARIVNALRLGMSIAGVTDKIVLAVQPVDANADVTASISWRER